ncbi:MAG: hypothetical protein AAGF11_55470, partial [Myxococcota bacterium]
MSSIGIGIGNNLDSYRRKINPAPPPRIPLSERSVSKQEKHGEQKQLGHELAIELAKVTHDAESAKTMAKRAGFPPEYLPDFKTAIGFWSAIVEESIGGRGCLKTLVK